MEKRKEVMSWSDYNAQQLRDPLNTTTRNARRNLLVASIVGIMIAKVGLFHTKFTALGIEFTTSNQHALVVLLFRRAAQIDLGRPSLRDNGESIR